MSLYDAAPISQNPFALPHMWVTALEGCWGPWHQLAGTVLSSPISDGLVHSLDFPLSPKKAMTLEFQPRASIAPDSGLVTLEFQPQASIVPWEVLCGDVRSATQEDSVYDPCWDTSPSPLHPLEQRTLTQIFT